MGVLVTNNAWGELAASITATTTLLTLKSGQGERFPTAVEGTSWFYVTLIDEQNNLEIAKCTARTSDSLTVVRGADNTERIPFNTGSRVELRPCAALFNDKLSHDEWESARDSLKADFTNTLNETTKTITNTVEGMQSSMANDYVTTAALEKALSEKDTANDSEFLSISDAAKKYLPLSGGTISGALKIEDNSASGLTMRGGDLTISKKTVNNQNLGGNITAAGTIKGETIRSTSDRRMKTDIVPLQNAGKIIDELKPVSFKWKSDGHPSFGFIAQDVQQVIPEIVHGDERHGYAMEYNCIIPFLVAEVQTLRKEIEELKK